MAALAAERDLLFGLLALQNGLIDQVQLVAAFQAWTRDRSRPLADNLVARGDLDPEQRAGVEAMVGLHLRKHGDAERSLAAVPAGRSTRESLAAIGDPEIEQTLTQLGSGSDGDADRTASYAVGTATADGQRFRILRPHAKGGLGAVFVALDAELHREVALKQILDSHADDPISRQRFLLEAEVTGGLEHPGIVPIYGLGTYGDGRPFYAMRFIRGDSLKQAIEHFHKDEPLKTDAGRRSLELRKLLRRFLDVCNAIEYAHARGVLHRDIKPGNVIVGKHGETLVVDWGLAKARGKGEGAEPTEERPLVPSSASGSAETLPGQALGTPAYMSPEQARGDLEALGPRSDSYSLGATLYCLLTGRPPFEGDDLGAVLGAVQRGDFAPPRRLDPAIDRPLEAVCLKAMAMEPDDRYASARALAEDLERWMADEPVTARREPMAARARRWMRRHRQAVAAAAAAAVMALVGLSAVVLIQSEANRRERRAKDLANQRLGLALEAVQDYYRGVTEEVLFKRPDLQDLRVQLLRAPQRFYQRLRDDLEVGDVHDPAARARLAQACSDLAAVTAQVGSVEEAITAYRQALAIREELDRRGPGRLADRVALAECLQALANLHSQIGQTDQAERAYRRALGLCRQLARDHPGEARFQDDLSKTLASYSLLLYRLGQSSQADSGLGSALEIQRRLVHDHPSVTGYRVELATRYHNLGVYDLEGGRYDRAEDHLRSAVDLRRQLAEAHPEVAPYRSDLAATLNSLANLYAATGQSDRAEGTYRAALENRRRLADELPTITAYRSALADTHYNLGLLQQGLRRFEQAEETHRAALEIRDRLAAEHPQVTEFPNDLAASHGTLANLYADTGQFDRAEASYRAALAIEDRLARDHPDVLNFREESSALQNNLGYLYLELGRFDEAEAAFLAALAIKEGLGRDHPGDLILRGKLGIAYANLGTLESERGRPAAALTWFDRAYRVLEPVHRQEPRERIARKFLIITHQGRAVALTRLGRPAEALTDWDRAIALDDGPDRDELRLGRAASACRLGSYHEAVALADNLAESESISGATLLQLACVYAQISAAIDGDTALAPAERAGRVESYGDRAIRLLLRARQNDYYRSRAKFRQALRDPDLDPVRSRVAFRLLLLDLGFPADPFAGVE